MTVAIKVEQKTEASAMPLGTLRLLKVTIGFNHILPGLLPSFMDNQSY